MRWVFVRPCYRSLYYDPEMQEPLGLQYLSAWRRSRGDQVLVLDSAFDGTDDWRLARRAAAYQPDAIGFSLTTARELDSVLAIHREAVQALAGHPVRWLAGGNFVSTEPEVAERCLPKGFTLVRFEGEVATDRFARDASAERDSVLVGEAVPDLDELPFPDRPFASAVLSSGWAFNLQGSRGCCGNCRYCSSPGMSPPGAKVWRGRSPDHLTDEIATLCRGFGARAFNIIDEDFLGPPRHAETRARGFAEALRVRNLRVSFGIQVRPSSLSEEIIDVLAEAGLTYVFMGLESDDPEDMRRWRRPWTADPWRLFRRLSDRGVHASAGVLLFHPHATFAGIRRFAKELHRYRLLNYRSAINRLDAMPGSEFHTRGRAAGDIAPDSVGPQALPYHHHGIAALHTDLAAAIGPLGPTSMHAVCALPPLAARALFDSDCNPSLSALQEIIARHDDAVAESLFALVDLHERGAGSRGLTADLQRRNLALAQQQAAALVAGGFAASAEALNDAIRHDGVL